MERKEKLFAYITSAEYVPLKIGEIAAVLDVPQDDRAELCALLDELCTEGKIFKSKKGRYSPIEGSEQCAIGRLSCNAKGSFGFLISDNPDDEDIFISGDDMKTALNGDRILARIEKKQENDAHMRGSVIRVLERGNKTVVGVIFKKKEGFFKLRPDNRQIYSNITIAPDKMMNAEIGDRVCVEITKYTDNGKVFGCVISILGKAESLKSCTEGIIIGNDIKQEFDEATIREAEKIPQKISEKHLKGREDIRDLMTFTIDGDDARDFDDAVSLRLTENGNYYLGVHIADVSEYVKEGTALDNEAYKRATSVYLADRVIPMLPEKLSNGICSLNPNEDRLTLSIFMEISNSGDVLNHRLVKSVIRSKERMTYNNVNKILDGDSELCERYNHILPTLKLMEKLAEILRERRIKRGAINFDFPESHVVVDENGEPVDIVKDIRGTSNKMIEEFMLIANETVAEYAFWSEIPFVYRNHEAPSLEKIQEFNDFLTPFGFSLKGKIDRDNPVHPKALQAVLDEVIGEPEERIISTNMLRSLMKAKYSEENLGHFGLAAKYYCHFTSPIRRYPDLAIHRILKFFIDGKLDDMRASHMRDFVCAAAKHSSDCEVNAEKTERDTDDLMKTAYMSRYIGEAFDGVVANVTSFGMFVELDNSVEGLIRLENMTDDYYEFDEKTCSLTGRRKRTVYKSGDCVRVVLAKTDILMRQIDFVLEKDATEKLLSSFEKKQKPIPKKPKKTSKKKPKYKKNKGKKKK